MAISIFKNVLFSFMLMFSVNTFPQKETWDQACYQESIRFQKWFPDRSFTPVCVNKKNEVISFRHLHGLVGELFYAKELKDKIAAGKLLLGYQCENTLACQLFVKVLKDKSKVHQKHLDGLPIDHHVLRKKVIRHGETMLENKRADLPEKSVCDDSISAGKWLSLLFSMYCPRGMEYSDCRAQKGSCLNNKNFQAQLNYLSGQSYKSLQYIEKLNLRGLKDCKQPWKTEVVCNGVKQSRFAFSCTNNQKVGFLCINN